MEQSCKNCGTQYSGNYCTQCGQKAKEVNLPLKELAKEVGDELVSFDARLLRSLKPFLLSPGTLTIEFLNGKRKRYISPLRLYLFMSFVYFFFSALLSSHEVKISPVFEGKNGEINTSDSTYLNISSEGSKFKFTVRDSLQTEALLGKGMVQALERLRNDPQMLYDKMKEYQQTMVFFLMPIFALLLKLLYLRRNVFYVQHLVYAIHVHAFIFFIFFIIEIMDIMNNSIVDIIAVATYMTIPLYIFFGLKRIFGQSSSKTFVKLGILTVSYLGAYLTTLLSVAAGIIYFYYT